MSVFRTNSRTILLKLFIVMALLVGAGQVNAQFKIKIKKPKVTIGKPKIRVPKKLPKITVGTPRVTVGAPRITVNPSQTLKDVTTVISTAMVQGTELYGRTATDVNRELGRGASNFIAEANRAKDNVLDVGRAVEKYAYMVVKGSGEMLSDASRRFREGKIVDAFFHLALDPLRNQEASLFALTQESSILNTVGTVAASAYGGPYGAAAYASWQAYRLSGGDAELALKAGIITGLTSAAMQGIGTMEGSNITEVIKKSVLAGAIGGLAVSASGGDADQIETAFLRGAAIVIIQDGYKNYIGHELNAEGARGEAYCISDTDPSYQTLMKAYSTDENGKLHYNTSLVDPNRPHVGIQADPLNPNLDLGWKGDNHFIMKAASKVPGMNAMALFHDKWVVSWEMTDWQNKATIIPAIVLTYTGTGASLYKSIVETTVQKKPSGVSSHTDHSKTATDNPQPRKVDHLPDTVVTNKSSEQKAVSVLPVITVSEEEKKAMLSNPEIVRKVSAENVRHLLESYNTPDTAKIMMPLEVEAERLVFYSTSLDKRNHLQFEDIPEGTWKLKVYNRWGKVVYLSEDYRNDWSPPQLKSDIYRYVLDVEEYQIRYKGEIFLIK